MRFRSALLAATMVALPLAANAQPIDGLYVGGGAGVNFMQREHFKSTFFGGTATLNPRAGFVGVLNLGWGFGNGFRTEIEGNYRYNSFNGAASGNEQKYGGMVNGLYDFYGLSPMVVPYIGGGIGYQAERLSGINQTKGSFAYQAIGGFAFPIASAPGLAVTAEYRFMGLAGNRTYGTVQSTDNYNHSLLLGVRYAFGAPAAAAVVVTQPPVAPAARSYLVFFDWDRSNLTDRARGIIRDAAANSAKVTYTKIDVSGNADTSGSHVYNQGLSLRRAQTVAAELVKDGVPKAAIAITAYGDTHLLVPTGPGVREPQNRRVEIVIR
jgi:OOP family OmpA-OmpF porin